MLCAKDNAEAKIRYLKWADRHDLVPSRYSLYHGEKGQRRILQSRQPHWFDHTTYWRRKYENRTLFCLTEPYIQSAISYIEKKENENLTINGLGTALITSSEKSLWNPGQTMMIFYFRRKKWL